MPQPPRVCLHFRLGQMSRRSRAAAFEIDRRPLCSELFDEAVTSFGCRCRSPGLLRKWLVCFSDGHFVACYAQAVAVISDLRFPLPVAVVRVESPTSFLCKQIITAMSRQMKSTVGDNYQTPSIGGDGERPA